MSARLPRRSFATPFVVTTLAACSGTHTSNPPGPVQPMQPTTTATTTAGGDPSATGEQPPGTATATPEHTENPPGPHKNPPPPSMPDPTPATEPAKFDQRWTIMKPMGSAECQAFRDVQCPKPEKGKPVATCNPPPPLKYACPDGFKDGDNLKIILRAGATECFVDYGPMKCPPNAACNPPRPRKLPCPS